MARGYCMHVFLLTRRLLERSLCLPRRNWHKVIFRHKSKRVTGLYFLWDLKMLFTSTLKGKGCAIIQQTGVNYKVYRYMWYQGYSFVGDNKPETLIVYCIIWIQAPSPPPPHSFTVEPVKICHFKTFRAENFALRTFCCYFLHYIHF